jgi:hypothetical protein
MSEILSDFANRAGEAFIESARCEDPERAAELRRKAYKLVKLVREREQMLAADKKG